MAEQREMRQVIKLLEAHRRFKSVLHGPRHWVRVHRFGTLMADEYGLDSEKRRCVEIFAWTHDLVREDDGPGNQHARDGAAYLDIVLPQVFGGLTAQQTAAIRAAIHYHSDGMAAEEAYYRGYLDGTGWDEATAIQVIGCCWDADRLDLMRLGRRPRPDLMSTEHWQALVPLAERLNARFR